MGEYARKSIFNFTGVDIGIKSKTFYCICRKEFNTEKSLKDHQRNKKHFQTNNKVKENESSN